MQKKRTKKISSFLNNQIDFTLCVTVLLLLALGIIMVLSASAPSSLAESGSSYTYVSKQITLAAVGLVLMIFISKIDYRFYKKYYWYIYIVSCLILLLVRIPGLGRTVNGATRWINLGFTQLQPSEITKIGMIIFYAGYLSEHKKDLASFWKGIVKPLIWLIPPIGILFVVQNHLSVSMVIGLVTLVMLIMAGCRMIYFYIAGGVVAVGGIGAILYMQATNTGGFRMQRILSFLDPWADAQGSGWQVIQSLYAIGSGGLFGVGLGESKQKYLYIPEPHNDFIFSILAEELGFVGCTVVIILFAIFIWRGIIIAMRAPDMFGSLLATGITALVAVQVIINIAVVTSSMPATGMPLPFFSYGGTALLILLCCVGVLLNISRAGSKV